MAIQEPAPAYASTTSPTFDYSGKSQAEIAAFIGGGSSPAPVVNPNPAKQASPIYSGILNSGQPTTSTNASGYAVPSVSTASPTVGASPIASSGIRRYTGLDPNTGIGSSAYDVAANDYFTNGAGSNRGPVDPSAIRASAVGAVQDQVAAINNTYASLTGSAVTAGVSQKGAVRATDARSGTLGSDFGNADLAASDTDTLKKIQALQDEKDSKVTSILDAANKNAQDMITAAQNTSDKNSADYLSYLKTAGDTANTQLKAFAAAGGKVEDLSDAEYNHFVTATGMSPQEIKAFVTLNQPASTVLHAEVQGNKYIQVMKDPITGKTTASTIDLGFTVPPDYVPTKLGNGQLAFYPKNPDPSKPLASQILTYGPATPVKGSAAAGTKPLTDGALKYTQADIAGVTQELNAHRGSDTYVDPYIYKSGFDKWIAKGGTPQGFVKLFPPNDNVNPASNGILPPVLQNTRTIKKTSGRSA